MTTVRDLSLKNQGGYVCKMYVKWKNPDSTWQKVHTATLDLGQSHTSNPGKHGAVDGAQVGLEIDIEGGTDVSATPSGLVFKSSSEVTANFVCAGTTLDPSLGFTGTSKS